MSALSMFGCSNGFSSEELKEIKNSPLNRFSYSMSGGMNGGHDSVSVKKVDESNVIISTSKSNYYYEESDVKEYLVSVDVLKDIEAIFRKNKMEKWNNKKFTDMIVYDAPSSSYSFIFGDKYTYVSFSSQMYPDKYGVALNQIHDVIDSYIASAKLLPGLVLDTVEEDYDKRQIIENEVVFTVFEYANDSLSYRIINGTSEDISLSKDIKLYEANNDDPIFETTKYGECIAYKEYCNEDSFTLDKRLDVGKYVLQIGEYQAEFEIR